ncbi:protein unc-93 homolog B1 isoform X4 [Hippopotamus amphibius kiboko]|uniref:protein unc-93 homolog B1 isoform X4 n=1 Tax=Hippopotamus amphibius kiboko TaxID=575201 RepID=UPI0025975330|nr:protein unc-93 homolog B1 isoform X4 [Hippopotamus amphibius kiboko]XP_057585454.1 protein unc-93 homolog B1 isoform X4 [Hippopotamus amphibius kiboko]
MEAEPPLYPVAGAAGPQGDEDQLGGPDGPEAPLDELVGAYPNYNEEEEERRYYRRKRLGVLKNVLAASAGGMLTYGVYLGLLQMQLILHYDETYREVKYGNMGLPDIDSKMLMGINVTPIAALLYTPVLIRFFGTKWMMFLAVGIYALFVSTNYWERYYTLVPSAVALGMAIVPLWASMGNYITRMAQKYYEYSHYKEQDEQGPQQRPPRGSHAPYLLVFQAIFYSFFHLSFACAQLPMIYFLNHYLYDLNHTLYSVKNCAGASSAASTRRFCGRCRGAETSLWWRACSWPWPSWPCCWCWACAARRTGPRRRSTCAAWAGATSSSCPSSTCATSACATSCPSLSTAASRCSLPALVWPWAMACAQWGWNAWRTSSWLIASAPRPPRPWACWGCGCHAQCPWWPGLACICCSLSASFSGRPRPGSCNTSGSSMQQLCSGVWAALSTRLGLAHSWESFTRTRRGKTSSSPSTTGGRPWPSSQSTWAQACP